MRLNKTRVLPVFEQYIIENFASCRLKSLKFYYIYRNKHLIIFDPVRIEVLPHLVLSNKDAFLFYLLTFIFTLFKKIKRTLFKLILASCQKMNLRHLTKGSSNKVTITSLFLWPYIKKSSVDIKAGPQWHFGH